MTQLRFALAQIDTCVGALDANAAKVLDYSRKAAAGNAQVVVFPEMTLTGYPIEDLALRRTFRQAAWDKANELATQLNDDASAICSWWSAPWAPTARPPSRATDWWSCTKRGLGWLRQALPAQLRRVRRIPHLLRRRPLRDPRRGRRHHWRGHLRGHLAGRRPGGRPGHQEHRPAAHHQRLAV